MHPGVVDGVCASFRCSDPTVRGLVPSIPFSCPYFFLFFFFSSRRLSLSAPWMLLVASVRWCRTLVVASCAPTGVRRHATIGCHDRVSVSFFLISCMKALFVLAFRGGGGGGGGAHSVLMLRLGAVRHCRCLFTEVCAAVYGGHTLDLPLARDGMLRLLGGRDHLHWS